MAAGTAYKALFRFYEDLNDFLPAGHRKKDKTYTFKGNPAVKDSIEAQNVPHTEVDLIVVNGNPVDFNYKLRDGDRVSVYPVFETLDIRPAIKTGRKPLRVTKFILDVHLGKLARLLRMTGFDTMYRNDYEDAEIIRIGEEETRIILTRDRGILKNSRVTRGYFIRSQKPWEQIKEVINRFQLQDDIKFLCRCIKCNSPIESVEKKEVAHMLKAGTANIYSRFFKCRGCGNIYWQGSHFNRMAGYMKRLQTELRSKQSG